MFHTILRIRRRGFGFGRAARHLGKAREGVAAVEFALIAPMLILLMIGITEICLIMFAQGVMEGAAYDASRRGRTGYADAGLTREETILATLNRRAGALMDTSLITISSFAYNQFDQIGQPEPFVDANGNGQRDEGENYTDINGNGQYDTDMGLAGAGNASQVVVYTIRYPWRIFTPMIGHFLGDAQTITLSSRAVIQNEPF